MGKKKSLLKVCFLLLATGAYACSDDSGSSNSPCSKCSDTETCIENVCVDQSRICSEVVCDEGELCVDSACVKKSDLCGDKVCQNGQVCKNDKCVDPDPCDTQTCDEGWQCIDGGCVETACINKTCDEGWQCIKGDCVETVCIDKKCDTGKTCVAGKCEFINAPALLLGDVEDKETDENGKKISVSVSLNNTPSSEVRVECQIVTESPNEEASVSCESILFDESTQGTSQYMMITGLDDDVIDGDQEYQVVLTTVSKDAEFNGLTATLDGLKNLDKDTAGITVDADNLHTDEGGSTATFTISLTSKPSNDVVIGVSSDNTAEGTVSPATITIHPDDWNKPQTVMITGVDDSLLDGNQTYHITFEKTVSEDENYNGLEIPALTVINQDNDVAGFMVSPETIETDEAAENGKKATMNIKLNTQPADDVTFSVIVSEQDAKEVSVSETSFTISADKWNEVKSIQAVGVADHIMDGDQSYEIKFVSTSNDTAYSNLEFVVKGVNLDLDKAGITTMLFGSPEVTEAGSTVEVGVMLTSIPQSNVTLNATVEDDTELSVSPASIEFTAATWNQAQKLVVKGLDDSIIDGDISSLLRMTLSSEDTHFNGLIDKLSFITRDDDVASLAIQSEATMLGEQTDTTVTMTVVLTAQPENDVTVNAVSSDTTELAVIDGAALTFTPENWNIPQTVTVQPVDDDFADDNQKVVVNFASVSEDKNFNELVGQSAEFTIVDNEIASVVLTAKTNELMPGAYSTEASVVLGCKPISEVTVTLATTNDKTAAISLQEVKFTPEDWDTPKVFTITMSDEEAMLAAINTEIISSVATGSVEYEGKKSNDVELKIYQFYDTLEFDYTGNVQKTKLLPGKFRLEVWGAQGGNGSSATTVFGAKGGYAAGVLNVTEKTDVFVYVGGQGSSTKGNETGVPGFNGGGQLPAHTTNSSSSHVTRGAGGGASDIRLVQDSLYARVIVAGGGGGAGGSADAGTCTYEGNLGEGGGETGAAGAECLCSPRRYGGGPGTQTSGGKFGTYSTEQGTATSGQFGIGGTGGNVTGNYYCGGSGGGGWYGGGGGAGGGGYGGGGSGWVYTEDNENAGYTNSSYTGGTWLLNSKHFLTSTQLIAGHASFNSPTGVEETGHPGNGYARITLIK